MDDGGRGGAAEGEDVAEGARKGVEAAVQTRRARHEEPRRRSRSRSRSPVRRAASVSRDSDGSESESDVDSDATPVVEEEEEEKAVRASAVFEAIAAESKKASANVGTIHAKRDAPPPELDEFDIMQAEKAEKRRRGQWICQSMNCSGVINSKYAEKCKGCGAMKRHFVLWNQKQEFRQGTGISTGATR